MILDSIDYAVGNTPLLRLTRLFGETTGARGIELFAKLEAFNPGGSAKDRSALGMLRDALDSGRLRPGQTVVESSSGNLGVALARACSLAGVRFVCVVDTRANPLTVAQIRALGGEISLVIEPDPETHDLLGARHRRVRELLAADPQAIQLDQYANPANPRAHQNGTMREVAEALDHRIDVLLVACSTTGTIGGCRRYVDEHGMGTRIVAVDAVGSVLFGGTAGARVLPGMGAGVVTELSRRVTPDEVVRVGDLEAVAGCRALARREGVLAGGSAGAVIWALGQQLAAVPDGSRVAVILHDGGVPYLQTVYDDAWVEATLGESSQRLASLVAELPR